jgi:hypothetical protein
MMDFYTEAIHSFQENLDWIERKGRKDSPDWHLANGLPRLAEGLRQDHEAEEERLKSFARAYRPLAGQHPCSLVSKT